MNTIELVFNVIMAVGAVATAAYAIITWRTLREMQTARNNAYRPDIIVSPKRFRGGLLTEDKYLKDDKYIYMNFSANNPGDVYTGGPTVDNCIYVEAPQLTLENIGQGTAKNIKLVFSLDWVKSAIDKLNADPKDNYKYRMDFHEINKTNDVPFYSCTCFTKDEDTEFMFFWEDMLVKNITYIKPQNETVSVPIPESWNIMLAILLQKGARKAINRSDINDIVYEIDIPELVITIQYTDIQEKEYEQIIKIPWSGRARIQMKHTEKSIQVEEAFIWNAFNEDYL